MFPTIMPSAPKKKKSVRLILLMINKVTKVKIIVVTPVAIDAANPGEMDQFSPPVARNIGPT